MTASGDLTDFTEPAESPNLIGPKPQDKCVKRRFCDKKGDRYIAIDCKSLKKKKSPRVWSFRDYRCEE